MTLEEALEKTASYAPDNGIGPYKGGEKIMNNREDALKLLKKVNGENSEGSGEGGNEKEAQLDELKNAILSDRRTKLIKGFLNLDWSKYKSSETSHKHSNKPLGGK